VLEEASTHKSVKPASSGNGRGEITQGKPVSLALLMRRGIAAEKKLSSGNIALSDTDVVTSTFDLLT